MNTYAEIAVFWAALDVLILVAWHLAHVLVRTPRTRPALSRPTPVRATSMRTPVGVG